MKRGIGKFGQVTIFIIIGVVLIGGILIGMFLFSNKTNVNNISFNSQASLIGDSVYDCFKLVSKDSLSLVGKQGGYSREPLSYYFDAGSDSLPFYYFGFL